jgi:hypothetical protein
MAYDSSSRHPTFETLEKGAGLAKVITGHVAATFASLYDRTSIEEPVSYARGPKKGSNKAHVRCVFCVARTSSFTSNASPEWMISMIALGRAASRSFRNARACPRYASGEYMHSVEK